MGKYGLNKTPKDVLYDLASKVKVLRKDCALTQPALAKKSGVSIGSIRRFEQTGQISLASLLRLLNVLGRLNDMEEILKSNKKENIENLFSDKTRK